MLPFVRLSSVAAVVAAARLEKRRRRRFGLLLDQFSRSVFQSVCCLATSRPSCVLPLCVDASSTTIRGSLATWEGWGEEFQ